MRFSRAPGSRTSDLPTSAREKNVPIKFHIGSEKSVIDTQDVLDGVRMRSIGNDGDQIDNRTEMSFRKSINTQRDMRLEDGVIGKDHLEPTTRAQLNNMNVDISVYGEKQQEGRKFVSKNARKAKQSIPHTATSYVEVEINPQRELPIAHHKERLAVGSRTESLDIQLDPRAQQPIASTRTVDHTMTSVESHPEVHSFTGDHSIASSRQKSVSSSNSVGFDLNVVQPFSREGRLKLTRQVSEFYSQTGRHMTHEELTTALQVRPEPKQVRRQVEVQDKPEMDHAEVNSVNRQRSLKSQKKDKLIRGRDLQDRPDVIVIPRDGESLGVDSSRKKTKQLGKAQRDHVDVNVTTSGDSPVKTSSSRKKTKQLGRAQRDQVEISHESVGRTTKIEAIRGKAPAHQTNNMTPPELSSDPTIRAQAMKDKQRPVVKTTKGPDVNREDVAVKTKSESRKVAKEKIKVKSRVHQEMPEVKFALFDPLQKALEEKMSRAGPKKIDPIVATEIVQPEVEEASKSNELRAKIIPVASEIVNEEVTETPEENANEVSKSTRRSGVKRSGAKSHRDEISTEMEKKIDTPKLKQVFF